jgi:hypothetical protein
MNKINLKNLIIKHFEINEILTKNDFLKYIEIIDIHGQKKIYIIKQFKIYLNIERFKNYFKYNEKFIESRERKKFIKVNFIINFI